MNVKAIKLFPSVMFFPLMAVLLGAAGCGEEKTPDSYTFVQTDTEYRLKQIAMCDSRNGWAVTSDNELLLTDRGPEGFSAVRKVDGTDERTDGFLGASFVDDRTAYLTYFSSDYLVVESTRDGGSSWEQTLIDYGEYGDTCDAGSAYISFPDAENGYLLYCSTPGAGIMTKLLLGTSDGGKSFSLIRDLSDVIAGYPQGITFIGKEGYLAVSYHGEDSYLYKTSDGGNTWEDLKVLPAQEGYVDGYPPVFDKTDNNKGILVLKTVGENTDYKLLTTADGGINWTQSGGMACESVGSYSWAGDNRLFFTDGNGALYEFSSNVFNGEFQ